MDSNEKDTPPRLGQILLALSVASDTIDPSEPSTAGQSKQFWTRWTDWDWLSLCVLGNPKPVFIYLFSYVFYFYPAFWLKALKAALIFHSWAR